MKLTEEVLDALDLQATIEAAVERPGDFFPSRLGLEAARRATQFVPSLKASLAAGWFPESAAFVQVPKWGGGTRPAIDLGVEERAVLDSLIRLVRRELVDGLVSHSPVGAARDAIEGQIGAATGYVLVSDVAAFYEYIDHDLLLTEVLELTGNNDATQALGELLGVLHDRRRGLPQGPATVGLLADIYLSVVDRRLARSGLDSFRFTDDYRVLAPTWIAVQLAQLRLERYLRDVGLVINTGKTTTPKADTYRSWRKSDQPPWLEALKAFVPEPVLDEHTGADDVAAAIGAYLGPPVLIRGVSIHDEIINAVEEDFRERVRPADYWGTSTNIRQSKLLAQCLDVLGPTLSEVPSRELGTFLATYPHLTSNVSKALRPLLHSEKGGVAADAIYEAITSGELLFDWQRGWLYYALATAAVQLSPKLLDLLRADLYRSDMPWFVRGQAAIVLATEHELAVDEQYNELFELSPHATKPDFVAAAALDPSGRDFTRRVSDPILRQVPDVVRDREWL